MGSVEIVGSPVTPIQRSHSDTFLAESLQDSDEEDGAASSSSLGSGYTLDDLTLVASPKENSPNVVSRDFYSIRRIRY